MVPLDLVPAPFRHERLFLLDVLAGREAAFDGDPDAFLAIAPAKLHPFLFARLRHARLPAGLRATLAAAARRNALQELRRGAELRRIDRALTARGIRYLLLKGPVLAATAYPDRTARTMTDLDFLVAAEEMTEAMAALQEAGFRIPPAFAGVALAAGDAPPLVHDDPGGPSIELHTMLDSLPDQPAALAATWPGARRVDVGHGLELATLERGEFFAHVATHVSKHHRFRGELRSLLDVALLLRLETLDWGTCLARWDRRGIAEWVALTATLARCLIGAPLPPALASRQVPAEALVLAAEQLWSPARAPVPASVTFALAGAPRPMHARAAATRVPIPGGLPGVRTRVSRLRDRLGWVLSATAHPRATLAEVAMHRKRERLYAIVEGAAEGQRSG